MDEQVRTQAFYRSLKALNELITLTETIINTAPSLKFPLIYSALSGVNVRGIAKGTHNLLSNYLTARSIQSAKAAEDLEFRSVIFCNQKNCTHKNDHCSKCNSWLHTQIMNGRRLQLQKPNGNKRWRNLKPRGRGYPFYNGHVIPQQQNNNEQQPNGNKKQINKKT